MSELTMKRDMYVYLIPSLACNLRHTFCFQRSFSNEMLSDEILYNKLKPLYERVKVLRLHSGELKVLPGMKDFVKWLIQYYPEMQINIVTNGVQFDDEWMDLAINHNIIINLSLNAVTPEVTQRILKN